MSVSGDDESYSHRGAREGEIGEFGKRSLCSGFRLFYQAIDTRTVGVRWVARYILATSYLKLDDCSRVGGRESVMTVTAQHTSPAPLCARVFLAQRGNYYPFNDKRWRVASQPDFFLLGSLSIRYGK